jgi:hypothetical protein
VQFVKVPSHLAIPVPCDENRAAASMDDEDQGWCGEPRLSDIQSSGPNGLTSWKSESTEQTYPGTIALLVMSLSMKRATLFIWCTPICTKVQHRSSCTVWGHVDEDCHGQPLARPHEERCHIALNGRHHFPLNFWRLRRAPVPSLSKPQSHRRRKRHWHVLHQTNEGRCPNEGQCL